MTGRTRRGAGPAATTAIWAGVGVLVAAAATPFMLIAPPLIAVVAGGFVLLALAAFLPKAFAFAALCTIILSTLAQTFLGSAGSFADEAVIVLALVAFSTRRLVTERRLVALPGMWWFLAFVAVGLASGIVGAVPFSISVQAMFLAVKGLVFAFALAQLRWDVEDLRVLVRLGAIAGGILVLTAVANLIAPGPWSQLVANRPPFAMVNGIPALQGPFQHPAAFGRLSSILAVGVLSYRLLVRRSWVSAVLLACSSAMALLTFQVKSIVSLLGTIGLLLLRFGGPVRYLAILAFAPLLAMVVLPPLVELVGGDVQIYIVQESARSLLTTGSLQVAADHFPWGAGFGRYASFYASQYYSPEYVKLGFEDVYGLGRAEDGMFLNDTQWPAILGETGWFGAVCFAAGIIAVFASLVRRTSADEHVLVRWLRVAGIAWLVLIIIESVGAPVFVSAPAFPFAFAAAGVIASFRDRARQAVEPTAAAAAPMATAPTAAAPRPEVPAS
ncbi:hypothetical protein BJ978_000119 [Agromyces terreus]|uniref:O-antigen ligase domain-containing protein n=1 Tax=Agromyces terreus TaxID=424795 RepID=A0A9X2K9N8_9MICO|nr:hypothetical protein [Agromyces terreus]MCP2369443.1 hypothetical protein [Agromyces terreus]